MQEYEVRKLVEAWQTMNDGIETEVIVVPSDDTLAETKIYRTSYGDHVGRRTGCLYYAL